MTSPCLLGDRFWEADQAAEIEVRVACAIARSASMNMLLKMVPLDCVGLLLLSVAVAGVIRL